MYVITIQVLALAPIPGMFVGPRNIMVTQCCGRSVNTTIPVNLLIKTGVAPDATMLALADAFRWMMVIFCPMIPAGRLTVWVPVVVFVR